MCSTPPVYLSSFQDNSLLPVHDGNLGADPYEIAYEPEVGSNATMSFALMPLLYEQDPLAPLKRCKLSI